MKTGALLLISALLLALFLYTLTYFELDARIQEILNHVEKTGITGQLVFAAITALSVVLMLPSVMLTMGAGYLFGVVHGSALVVVSETIGATIAFLIARYLLGHKASSWLKQRAKISHVSHSVLAHGWQVIAAFRIIPFFPFKLSNYFFGLLPVTLRNYLLGTFLGLWPITLFNVYLGSLASDVLSTGAESQTRTSAQWIIYGFGFVLTVVAVVYLSRLARRTLTDYRRAEE